VGNGDGFGGCRVMAERTMGGSSGVVGIGNWSRPGYVRVVRSVG
jgi:hypothetical protein